MPAMPHPAIHSATDTEGSALSSWSCFSCRRRKVRCDRRAPCTPCSRGGVDCSFPSSGRRPTRQADPAAPGDSKLKQAELRGRLRRLEGIVESLSTQLRGDSARDFHPSGTGSDLQGEGVESTTEDPQQNTESEQLAGEIGRLIIRQDGSLYIGNLFWTVLSKEVERVRQAFEEDDCSDAESGDEQEQLFESPASRIPFSCGYEAGGGTSQQPLPSQVPFIWQVFVENIDPFIKVLHIPTMTKAILNSKGRFNSLPPAMEALMFAISLAAISSLSEDEVVANFGDLKVNLITRFTLGTEQALLRAGVFCTSDRVVVQAFAMYLEFAGQTYGTRAVWVMTGLLVRTAMSMGLHRDGSHFPNVSPFETEMRRRLWWQICFINLRVGDCEGSEKLHSESPFDTRGPTNVNDADIDPSMSDKPVSRDGYTDVTVSLLCVEFCRLAGRILSAKSAHHSGPDSLGQILEQRLLILEKSRGFVSKTYLVHLRPDKPLHSFVATVACLALTRSELLIRHGDVYGETSRTNGLDDGQGTRSFLSALASIEHIHGLAAQPWAWLFRDCAQWHALGVILMELRKRPWGPTCERAWTAAQKAFDDVYEAAWKETHDHPVHGLMAAVRKHREQELRRLGQRPEVYRQLTQLARVRPSVPRQPLEAPSGGTAFDISVAEERLALETAVATAVGGQPLVIDDLGVGNVPDLDVASDWGSSVFKLAEPAFPGQETLFGPGTIPAMADLGSDTGHVAFDSDLMCEQFGGPLQRSFIGSATADTLQGEMGWFACGEAVETGSLPW